MRTKRKSKWSKWKWITTCLLCDAKPSIFIYPNHKNKVIVKPMQDTFKKDIMDINKELFFHWWSVIKMMITKWNEPPKDTKKNQRRPLGFNEQRSRHSLFSLLFSSPSSQKLPLLLSFNHLKAYFSPFDFHSNLFFPKKIPPALFSFFYLT